MLIYICIDVHVYIYIYVCICMCEYTYINLHKWANHTNGYVHIYICKGTLYIYIYIHTHIHAFINLYTYTYIYTYIHVYVYTYICTHRGFTGLEAAGEGRRKQFGDQVLKAFVMFLIGRPSGAYQSSSFGVVLM